MERSDISYKREFIPLNAPKFSKKILVLPMRRDDQLTKLTQGEGRHKL